MNPLPRPDASPSLTVGERVRLEGRAEHPRRWWTVRAASDRFAILTAPAPFEPRGTLMYTACDFEQGIRGAVNLIGGGYGDGTYSQDECERMLADLEAGPGSEFWLEISHRNRVPLAIAERRQG